jgi:hypothetical protein
MDRKRLLAVMALLGLLFIVPVSSAPGKRVSEADMEQIWTSCNLKSHMKKELFRSAVAGYNKTDSLRKKNILVIIDFTRPSTTERFFVLDMTGRKLLFHCLVAHGKNNGLLTADTFSNEPGSLKSSLGFYLTAETYTGKHGYSLRLDGLEKGFNDNARARDIVIHGADYVSVELAESAGRIGRSWGCPALPVQLSRKIIDSIAGGSCLFIYGSDRNYLSSSLFLK